MSAIEKFDYTLVEFLKKTNVPFARFTIFTIYFWFGILKIFDVSAAIPLVEKLMEKNIPGFFNDPRNIPCYFLHLRNGHWKQARSS